MTSLAIQNHPKPHILIVDDDKEIRTLLSEILEKNELIYLNSIPISALKFCNFFRFYITHVISSYDVNWSKVVISQKSLVMTSSHINFILTPA